MKSCSFCGDLKEYSQFHARKTSKDGKTSQCKECCKVFRKKHYEKNKEKELERSRKWKLENPEKNLSTQKKWRKKNKEKYRLIVKRHAESYKKRNNHKIKARRKVAYAMSVGKIKKENCKICKAENSEAHHNDYDKPLNVIWLCQKCHKKEHRKKDERYFRKIQ